LRDLNCLFVSKRREGMPSSDLFRFAITLSFQQTRAKIRRNVVAFAGIAGGIVLVFVQLGFQSALYESAVRLHRILNGEIVVVASKFRSIQDPTWFSREWLVMTQAHPAVVSVAPLYLSPVAVRNIDDRTVRTLLGIGIELDEPALKTERLDADLRSLRIPGRIREFQREPCDYTACVFAGPLALQDPGLRPEIGIPTPAALEAFYRAFERYRLGSAAPHCNGRLIPESLFAQFKMHSD